MPTQKVAAYSHFELAPNLLPSMSVRLDFTMLPTARDVTQVNNEIKIIEQKLKDALLDPTCPETTVAELKSELEIMRAWIAPIRRLNTDILSLIFEICGKDDWKTSLRIAATSRDWRNLILATPRAWEFCHPPGTYHYERVVKSVELFIERSHPRPLHFFVPYNSKASLLSSISQRLECLTIESFSDDMETLVFPNLKRLVVNCERDIQTSLFDPARFPALRHLACVDFLGEDEDVPFQDGDLLSLPPLQSLTLHISGSSHWLSILQACKDTLISLGLDADDPPDVINDAPLVFPRLISLELQYSAGMSGDWPVDLRTPALETYTEYTYSSHSDDFMHTDVETVTCLRTDRQPESSRLPKVKLIQFSKSKAAILLLNHLLSNPAHHVKLETIEVKMGNEPADHIVNLVAKVNRDLERNISLILTSKLRYLNGMVKTYMCGSDMPCHYRPSTVPGFYD